MARLAVPLEVEVEPGFFAERVLEPDDLGHCTVEAWIDITKALDGIGPRAAEGKQHLDGAVQRILTIGLDRINDPYSKIQLGAAIRTLPGGTFEANYDVDARRIMGEIVRAQHGTAPPPAGRGEVNLTERKAFCENHWFVVLPQF